MLHVDVVRVCIVETDVEPQLGAVGEHLTSVEILTTGLMK